MGTARCALLLNMHANDAFARLGSCIHNWLLTLHASHNLSGAGTQLRAMSSSSSKDELFSTPVSVHLARSMWLLQAESHSTGAAGRHRTARRRHCGLHHAAGMLLVLQPAPSPVHLLYFTCLSVQTMYRIKDPKRSLDFYTRVCGMR